MKKILFLFIFFEILFGAQKECENMADMISGCYEVINGEQLYYKNNNIVKKITQNKKSGMIFTTEFDPQNPKIIKAKYIELLDGKTWPMNSGLHIYMYDSVRITGLVGKKVRKAEIKFNNNVAYERNYYYANGRKVFEKDKVGINRIFYETGNIAGEFYVDEGGYIDFKKGPAKLILEDGRTFMLKDRKNMSYGLELVCPKESNRGYALAPDRLNSTFYEDPNDVKRECWIKN